MNDIGLLETGTCMRENRVRGVFYARGELDKTRRLILGDKCDVCFQENTPRGTATAAAKLKTARNGSAGVSEW